MVNEDADDEAPPALVDLSASDAFFAPPTPAPAPAKAAALSDALLQPAAPTATRAAPTPLTILTGFLGAGKTTLVSSLLRHFGSLGQRVCIINNEASAASVEPSLVESSSVMSFGTLLTLANGCICCSLTSDLISALNYLLQPQTTAPFVYVLVECSGLASPGPLLEQLWVDDALEQRIYLDGVVCVVDASHFRANLRGGEGAQMEQQLVFSDAVLVNKTDTVSDDERRQVVAAVQRINSQCDVYETERAQLPVDSILHLRAFDNSVPRHAPHAHTDSCECRPSDASSLPSPRPNSSAPHIHDASLVNLVFTSPRRVSLPALKTWLSELLWRDVYDDKQSSTEGEQSTAIAAAHSSTSTAEAAAGGAQCVYRMKAAMRASDGSVWFLQSVQSLFDLFEAEAEEDKRSVTGVRLVVIGRNLQQVKLEAGFQTILVEQTDAVR